MLGVEQHVLRFWESKFPFIRPTKRAGGRRFYRPQDLALLQGVKTLLYDRGYTIRGVQILFKDEGQKAILAATDDSQVTSSSDETQSRHNADVSDYVEDLNEASPVSAETRQRFLEIARMLEDAQLILGKALNRHR